MPEPITPATSLFVVECRVPIVGAVRQEIEATTHEEAARIYRCNHPAITGYAELKVANVGYFMQAPVSAADRTAKVIHSHPAPSN